VSNPIDICIYKYRNIKDYLHNYLCEDLSVQYAKARLDSLFADRAQRLNEGKGLPKDIYLSEEYRRCLNNFFLIIVLAAFANRKILTYHLTMKNLIHMSCY
jgi:hypothetical protein